MGEDAPLAGQSFAVLSIGALSRATGVPVETLRTWERRYDFPRPEPREGSGHRRYPLAAVERLRFVVRALEANHAPSIVLRADLETLQTLVAVSDGSPKQPGLRPRAPLETDSSFEDRCTRHVLNLDGDALRAEFERAWDTVGGLECLMTAVGPFLNALGTGWSQGDVEVGHEHFASEHVREFLIRHWRPMSERNDSPRIVCATLTGELHVLGLHMAATALAISGAHVVFLGADTPTEDVARAVTQRRAQAVALSAARGTSSERLGREVSALRALVPAAIPIVVGGAGFLQVPDGVVARHDLRELGRWSAGLPALPPPPGARSGRRRG